MGIAPDTDVHEPDAHPPRDITSPGDGSASVAGGANADARSLLANDGDATDVEADGDAMKTTPTPHDAHFKSVYGQPEHAAGYFKAYLPQDVARHVDFASLTPWRCKSQA